MKDTITRAISGNHQVRLFVAETREMVEMGRQIHQTTPVATAALGRTLTAAAMMGLMMKGDKDLLTLRLSGDGPIGGVLATANAKGYVKGYVKNPQVMLPLNEQGKLDVGRAIGKGQLNLIKDIGMKEPYNGQIDLVSGEVADDLTYYFASSEQTPSVVALGVLVGTTQRVQQSGGFILQLMPDAEEATIVQVEKNIQHLASVTSMLESGMDGKAIVEKVLENLAPVILDQVPTKYACDCSKKRVERALMTVGEEELISMIEAGEPIEMSCHFCQKNYVFSLEELSDLLEVGRKA